MIDKLLLRIAMYVATTIETVAMLYRVARGKTSLKEENRVAANRLANIRQDSVRVKLGQQPLHPETNDYARCVRIIHIFGVLIVILTTVATVYAHYITEDISFVRLFISTAMFWVGLRALFFDEKKALK